MNKQEVDVVAGVIIRHDGRFLLGQRAPGSFYPGYWEFPGGKIEPGESPEKALRRELKEELGIDVSRFYPWIVRTHCYEHARVKLRFFEVAQWQGEPHPHVHDNLCWLTPGQNMPSPILPANGPVLKALTLPRRMGITQAAAIGCDAQLAALNRALDAGLRLIQIREKALPTSARREFVREAV
ncbi:MAG: NUDIX domain-containing protein, partial [Azoarcus sp.]|nr:NUDIX domain-containing protein [Azoarcus sp.]